MPSTSRLSKPIACRLKAWLPAAIALGLAGTATSLLAAGSGEAAVAPQSASSAAASASVSAASRTPAPYWAPLPAPPAGAPNVLLIMTDDVGFGASSVFGGPVPTPNFQRLADHGLRYTQFNTTGMCSPTRAALLTGRNHHAVGFGSITEGEAGFPGYNTIMPANSRTFVEVMERDGYATSMFGKVHLVSMWQGALTGSHRQWPTKLGFDYFYGFLAADADQWHPNLYRGNNLVNVEVDHTGMLDHRLADDAIRWIHQEKADSPDKPFMVYYATGSTHAPHQAPPDWIARFKGKFDGGWDAVRAQTVARQRRMGLLPANAPVTPRPAALKAWDSLSPADQRVYERYMEVYAGELAYEDAQIGRIIAELKRMNQWDNTLVIMIMGDNGASAEGGPEGTTSELRRILDAPAHISPAERADIDRLGGPDTYENYPAGWAWAMNAPNPLFKQDASHLGGTRNGLIISWPHKIALPGAVVTSFAHITDIAPTILQAAGLQFPATIDGVKQTPLVGRSLMPTFTDPAVLEGRRTQYFELYGNRALYKDGWWASTVPGRMPWQHLSALPAADFKWQLFNLKTDPAQAVDLSARYPHRLAQMRRDWTREAQASHVFPLRADGLAPAFRNSRRPTVQRNNWVFWGPDVHLPWTEQPDLQGGSFTILADFTLQSAVDGEGVILATGSSLAGWSLKLEGGVPVLYDMASEAAADRYRIAASQAVAAGQHQLKVQFIADSPKFAAGGTVVMTLDGQEIARQHVGDRAVLMSSEDEMFDIGMDTGASVIPGVEGRQQFAGRIEKVAVTTNQQ